MLRRSNKLAQTSTAPTVESRFNGPWPLNLELLHLSSKDAWTLRDACESVLILGQTGGGKSSGPFQLITRSLLRWGCGGLFLCAKPSARDEYVELARREGREADVVIVSTKKGEETGYNFLSHEIKRQKHSVSVDSIAAVFMQAHEVTGRSFNERDPFWDNAARQLMRNCLEVVINAGLDEQGEPQEIRLETIAAIISTLPQSSSDVRMPEGLEAMEQLRMAQSKVAPEREKDLELAAVYFETTWPRLAERTRSSIAQVLTVLLDRFMRTPLRPLLLEKTDCTPQDVLDGKLVIVDVPINETPDLGKIVGVVWKLAVQRAILSRTLPQGPADGVRPVFIAADEGQYWLTDYDANFQQTSRSARGITVFATQNLPNLYAELSGSPSGMARVKSFLGNLQTRLACRNTDPETNLYLAESIGQKIVQRQSRSFRGLLGWPEGQTVSEQVDFDVRPRKFTTLRTGGEKNDFMVEALVTRGGERFKANNGARWMVASFDQKCRQDDWKSRLLTGDRVRITARKERE